MLVGSTKRALKEANTYRKGAESAILRFHEMRYRAGELHLDDGAGGGAGDCVVGHKRASDNTTEEE